MTVAAVASSSLLLCEESMSHSDDGTAILGLDRLAMSGERGEDFHQPCQLDCALQFGECMALLVSQESVGRYLPCKLFVRQLLLERSPLVELRRATVVWILELRSLLRLDVSVAASAVSMLDRFVSSSSCQVQSSHSPLHLNLAGLACMWLAAKYSGSRVLDFWHLKGAAAKVGFDAASIRRMELIVLRSLGWSAVTLTPHDFIFNAIRHLAKAAFLQYQPSVIGSCILQCVLDESIPVQSADFMDRLRTTLAVDMISSWDCYQLLMDRVVDPEDCCCAAPSPDHVAGAHLSHLDQINKGSQLAQHIRMVRRDKYVKAMPGYGGHVPCMRNHIVGRSFSDSTVRASQCEKAFRRDDYASVAPLTVESRPQGRDFLYAQTAKTGYELLDKRALEPRISKKRPSGALFHATGRLDVRGMEKVAGTTEECVTKTVKSASLPVAPYRDPTLQLRKSFHKMSLEQPEIPTVPGYTDKPTVKELLYYWDTRPQGKQTADKHRIPGYQGYIPSKSNHVFAKTAGAASNLAALAENTLRERKNAGSLYELVDNPPQVRHAWGKRLTLLVPSSRGKSTSTHKVRSASSKWSLGPTI
ncbi:hypothetical protein SELMODRAFT_412206 [Selaginella moellendorffii]|uniref:Cyclin-like domain-containing protein n=1 Tax=Selaginella moellendorffii TaxID=88036 RepID=D8RKF2_SELML|nr:hypothetical protein SELMODRAFT_412206 [Selaginella moellendorffii]